MPLSETKKEPDLEEVSKAGGFVPRFRAITKNPVSLCCNKCWSEGEGIFQVLLYLTTKQFLMQQVLSLYLLIVSAILISF